MLLREPCRATIPTRSGESLSVLTKAVAGVWRIRGLAGARSYSLSQVTVSGLACSARPLSGLSETGVVMQVTDDKTSS
jgi:hypothetical protein